MKIVIGTGQFGENYADELAAQFPEAHVQHGSHRSG